MSKTKTKTYDEEIAELKAKRNKLIAQRDRELQGEFDGLAETLAEAVAMSDLSRYKQEFVVDGREWTVYVSRKKIKPTEETKGE